MRTPIRPVRALPEFVFGIFHRRRQIIAGDPKIAIGLVVDRYRLQLVDASVELCDSLLFVVTLEDDIALQVEFVFLFGGQFVGHGLSFTPLRPFGEGKNSLARVRPQAL